MSAIDLIVLGIIKQEPQGAYDIQRAVEYRNLSKWVKVSTPSVYKKVLQLEEKGMIKGRTEKNGNMPEKVVYSLTKSGEQYFKELMIALSDNSIALLFDFNAVIVNLENVSIDTKQQCIDSICKRINEFRVNLENMVEVRKHIPQNGQNVLNQQLQLAEVLEDWAENLRSY